MISEPMDVMSVFPSRRSTRARLSFIGPSSSRHRRNENRHRNYRGIGRDLGVRTLEALKFLGVETHLILSKWARSTLAHETSLHLEQLEKHASSFIIPTTRPRPFPAALLKQTV